MSMPLLLAFGALIMFASGCASRKSQADERVKAAYLAGQRDALLSPRGQPGHDTVTIVGPVRTPTIPWTRDMTLSKAIVNAGYQGASDPAQILIIRNYQAIPVDTKSLLSGHDVALVPGDMVVLQ